MKIGIIQTGHVSEALQARFGAYPAMFESLLAPHLPGASFETVSVIDGETLPDPRTCDGWVITGSRHGVYEDAPWIEALRGWTRGAVDAGAPLIGVCFGHQIIADALGGRVEKYAGGWRVGAAVYEVGLRPGWAGALPDRPRMRRLHQDQVLEAPEGARLWMAAEGAAISGLIYGDPERPEAISVQPHPEFSHDYAAELIAHLEEVGRISSDVSRTALAELRARDDDNAAIGAAFAGYLRLGPR